MDVAYLGSEVGGRSPRPPCRICPLPSARRRGPLPCLCRLPNKHDAHARRQRNATTRGRERASELVLTGQPPAATSATSAAMPPCRLSWAAPNVKSQSLASMVEDAVILTSCVLSAKSGLVTWCTSCRARGQRPAASGCCAALCEDSSPRLARAAAAIARSCLTCVHCRLSLADSAIRDLTWDVRTGGVTSWPGWPADRLARPVGRSIVRALAAHGGTVVRCPEATRGSCMSGNFQYRLN